MTRVFAGKKIENLRAKCLRTGLISSDVPFFSVVLNTVISSSAVSPIRRTMCWAVLAVDGSIARESSSAHGTAAHGTRRGGVLRGRPSRKPREAMKLDSASAETVELHGSSLKGLRLGLDEHSY